MNQMLEKAVKYLLIHKTFPGRPNVSKILHFLSRNWTELTVFATQATRKQKRSQARERRKEEMRRRLMAEATRKTPEVEQSPSEPQPRVDEKPVKSRPKEARRVEERKVAREHEKKVQTSCNQVGSTTHRPEKHRRKLRKDTSEPINQRLAEKYTKNWDLCYAFKKGRCKNRKCKWRHAKP